MSGCLREKRKKKKPHLSYLFHFSNVIIYFVSFPDFFLFFFKSNLETQRIQLFVDGTFSLLLAEIQHPQIPAVNGESTLPDSKSVYVSWRMQTEIKQNI